MLRKSAAIEQLVLHEHRYCSRRPRNDGLDEYSPESEHGTQIDFLVEWLKAAEDNDKVSIKICLASRELGMIHSKLFEFPRCKIHEWTQESIAMLAENKIRPLAPSPETTILSQADWDKLIEKVSTLSEGVFIWVILALDEFPARATEGASVDESLAFFQSLPKELDDLYVRILDKIRDTNLTAAMNYFQLLGLDIRQGLKVRTYENNKLANQTLSFEEFAIASQYPRTSISRDFLSQKTMITWLTTLYNATTIRVRGCCGGMVQISSSKTKPSFKGKVNCNVVDWLHITAKKSSQ